MIVSSHVRLLSQENHSILITLYFKHVKANLQIFSVVAMSITILKITIYVSMGLYGAWALFAIFAICGVNCVSEFFFFFLLFERIIFLTILVRNKLA